MRLLADLHISPETVEFLRASGHDVVRINEVAKPTTPDREILTLAARDHRTILTQDLDVSALVALGGCRFPSLISLRLASSRVEYVNGILERALPELETDVQEGTVITITDQRIRRRTLPIS